MNLKTIKKNIYDLCNVERAVKGKIYKAGSLFVKLSASDDTVGQLGMDGTIGTRFAVFEPKENINTDYLKIAVENKFPEFLYRYRTTINLQFQNLKFLEIDWHEDPETQNQIVRIYKKVDKAEDLLKKQIANEKEMKRFYLTKMMEIEKS